MPIIKDVPEQVNKVTGRVSFRTYYPDGEVWYTDAISGHSVKECEADEV